MLKRILNVNPETRITIGKIRESPWYNQTETKYGAVGIIVGRDRIEVSDEIVKKMQVLGYNTTHLKA
jgi:hypothetical protein